MMREKTPSTLTTAHNDAPPCLSLRPRDAAKALGIGERKLWSLTNCGEIPHIKLGKVTLYPVDSLREWLVQQVRGGAAR